MADGDKTEETRPDDINIVIANLEEKINNIESSVQYIIDRNQDFDKEKKGLLDNISESKENIQKIIASARDEQKALFNTLSSQKNQEITGAIDLKKTEIDNFKNETNTKITSFISERKIEIDSCIEQLNSSFVAAENKRQIEYENLKAEIVGLLPQASAVGISKAFSDEKKSHDDSMTWYRRAFILTILAMLIMPFIAYKTGMIVNFFESQNQDIGLQKFFFSAIRLAAIELPLVWLATLMSKKIQQHQRIHEEYVHKYTAAMTFVGMSKEAKENTKIFGEDHIKKLTEGFRDAVYMNPSNTLDKDVKSESPLETMTSLVKDVGPEALKAMIDGIKK